MSHNPERKEKNCLNCNTLVHGRFCHVCGQENIETKESFLSLAKHFIYDILHFDGKFFYTVKYLFTRPGYVARQYTEGKRASYLHPIRMYLFTSAIFFLVFFSVDVIHFTSSEHPSVPNNEERKEMAEDYQSKLEKNPGNAKLKDRIKILLDTTKLINLDSLHWRDDDFIVSDKKEYHSIKEYDADQDTTSIKMKDNWIERSFMHKFIYLSQKNKGRSDMQQVYTETFLHKLPYLFFVSLPFFALLLKLLYTRRKNFYYSDHAVFTLFHYILSFIMLLVMLVIIKIRTAVPWGGFSYLITCINLGWLVYLYLQMKNFYQQGRFKTFVKFLLLCVLAFFVLLILFLFFLLFYLFQL